MDLLLILRDALASSLVGGLLMALNARAEGRAVGVLFTQEALAAAIGGSFEWPRGLSGQEIRLTMADRGGAMDVPLLGRGDGRQLDAKGLIAKAHDAGVVLYACPIWTSLLGLDGKIPEHLQSLDSASLPGLLQDAKRVLGAL